MTLNVILNFLDFVLVVAELFLWCSIQLANAVRGILALGGIGAQLGFLFYQLEST